MRRGYTSSTLYVTFRFSVGGASYTQEQEVGGSTFAALSEGAKVQVLYLPRNPGGTARLASEDNRAITSAYSLGGGCLIAAVILLIIGVGSASSAASQENAAQIGTAALGSNLALVRSALEPHFAAWKEATDQAIHRVSPAEAGLSSLNLGTIVYGNCPNGAFYVFVPRAPTGGDVPGAYIGSAFGYTSNPEVVCDPPGDRWFVIKDSDLGNGWFLATVTFALETPTPSPQ